MKKLSILLVCLLLLPVISVKGVTEGFVNGDFAQTDGHMPVGWSVGYGSSAVPGENIQVLENQYNGKNALRLYDPNNTGTAHYKHMTITQTVKNLIPGAEYAVTGYSRMITKGTSQGGVIKVSVGGKESDITAYYSAPGVWEKQMIRFAMPENVTTASVLLRLVGGGEILWADMQLICLRKYISEFDADSVFYYTDMKEGTATVLLNPYFSETVNGNKVLFAIEDSGNILWQQTVSLTAGAAKTKFPLSVLGTEKKPYTLRATLQDADGIMLESQTQSVYRYKRPEMILEDGTCKVQGKTFNPVFAYHVRERHYKACAGAGINVVQNAMHTTVQGYLDMLNGALDENGKPIVYMLLPLYNGMVPAGHPANLSLTRELVQSEAIRNHPALFGYIVMDEPFLNMEHPEEHLERAYVTIREYDDVHPVLVMENYPEKYGVSAKYADILGADIYAGTADENIPVSEHVTQRSVLAKAAAGQKPLWVLLQTFDYLNYFPTATELRGQIYQAMLAGADAVGFFKIEKASEGKDLCNMPVWNLISNVCTGTEYRLLIETKSFTTIEDTEFIARQWNGPDGQYVQVLNRTMCAQTVEVVLGTLKSGIYEASILYGDASEAEVDLKQSVLRVTLPAASAATIVLKYDNAVCYAIDTETGAYISEVSGGETIDLIIDTGSIPVAENRLQFAVAFYTDSSERELCDIRMYTKDKESIIRVNEIETPEKFDMMQVYILLEGARFYRLAKLL